MQTDTQITELIFTSYDRFNIRPEQPIFSQQQHSFDDTSHSKKYSTEISTDFYHSCAERTGSSFPIDSNKSITLCSHTIREAVASQHRENKQLRLKYLDSQLIILARGKYM